MTLLCAGRSMPKKCRNASASVFLVKRQYSKCRASTACETWMLNRLFAQRGPGTAIVAMLGSGLGGSQFLLFSPSMYLN